MKPRNSLALTAAFVAASAFAAQAQTLRDGAVVGGAAPVAADDAPPVAVAPLATERKIEIRVDAGRLADGALAPMRLSFVGPAFRPEPEAVRTAIEGLLADRGIVLVGDAVAAQNLIFSFGGRGYVRGVNAEALRSHVERLLSARRTASTSAASNARWVSLDGIAETPPENRYALFDGYGGNGGEAKLSVFLPFGGEDAPGGPAKSTLDALLVNAQGEPIWRGVASGAFGGLSVDFAVEKMGELLVDALGETRQDARRVIAAPLPAVRVPGG